MKHLFCGLVVCLLGLNGQLGAQVKALPGDLSPSVMSKDIKAVEGVESTGVPRRLTYQGVLTGPSGAPVDDGVYDLTVSLFDVPSAGVALWSDGFTPAVERGSFTVILGSNAALGLSFDKTYYVEVTVTGGPSGPSYPETLLPRTELTSSPYALAPWVPNGTSIGFTAGNVGIGTTSPAFKLDVSDDVNVAPDKSYRIGGTKVLSSSSHNLFVGYDAGFHNTTGDYGTAVGENALNANTTGNFNTAVGNQALVNNAIGAWNSAFGVNTLGTNTAGSLNTAIGVYAMIGNISGNDNTAVGDHALSQNTSGSSNTAVGEYSLDGNATGEKNTALGGFAVNFNSSGSFNSAVGWEALKLNTTGSYNSALGQGALASNDTGSYLTAVGFGADVNSSNLTNATAIGANAKVSASNSLVLGNNANVGIGTGAPTEKLEVAGNIKIGNATLRSGTGNPEGAVTGNVGDLFLRTDGGAGTTLYVKESGNGTNTGWVGK